VTHAQLARLRRRRGLYRTVLAAAGGVLIGVGILVAIVGALAKADADRKYYHASLTTMRGASDRLKAAQEIDRQILDELKAIHATIREAIARPGADGAKIDDLSTSLGRIDGRLAELIRADAVRRGVQ
jgi:hypothetical protein